MKTFYDVKFVDRRISNSLLGEPHPNFYKRDFICRNNLYKCSVQQSFQLPSEWKLYWRVEGCIFFDLGPAECSLKGTLFGNTRQAANLPPLKFVSGLW